MVKHTYAKLSNSSANGLSTICERNGGDMVVCVVDTRQTTSGKYSFLSQRLISRRIPNEPETSMPTHHVTPSLTCLFLIQFFSLIEHKLAKESGAWPSKVRFSLWIMITDFKNRIHVRKLWAKQFSKFAVDTIKNKIIKRKILDVIRIYRNRWIK